MKQKFFTLILMASFVLFTGCYPDGAENTEDFDIVYSAYDEGYNFQNAGTYSMPEEILILGDDEEIEFVPDGPAANILEKIDENLQALGWTKIENPEFDNPTAPKPDVEFLPVSWTTTTISYWGGGYWCYWDPYYCGGGWYYPYPVVTSYTTGTLLFTMIDYNALNNDGKRKAVWTGALNGLFQGNYNDGRINKGIDQVFAQSPYLKIN